MMIVPDLAQRAIRAADVRQIPSRRLNEAGLDICQCVCGVARGDDTARSQIVLSRQLLVEQNNFLKELNELELRRVVCVAGRTQSGHAGAVFAPLMLPKFFVRAVGGGDDRVILDFCISMGLSVHQKMRRRTLQFSLI